MEVVVMLKLIAKKELTRVIVDSTVHEKAVAHPTDSKLQKTARSKVVEAAKTHGIELKQTYTKEGQMLGYKAGRYTHARQFKRMRKVVKRQRTIVRRLQHETAYISKGNSRNSCEFELKMVMAMALEDNLIVGAMSFTGNLYDGYAIHE
jgi:transposase, IS5 family